MTTKRPTRVSRQETITDNERRARDRAWSSQGTERSDYDRTRINSIDSGTGGVGVYDQAPHKAMRKSEVDMLAYDLDAPLLGQQEEVMQKNVGLMVVN